MHTTHCFCFVLYFLVWSRIRRFIDSCQNSFSSYDHIYSALEFNVLGFNQFEHSFIYYLDTFI